MFQFLKMVETVLGTLDVVCTDGVQADVGNLWAGGGGLLDGEPQVGVSTGQFVVGGRIEERRSGLARTCQGISPQGPGLSGNSSQHMGDALLETFQLNKNSYFNIYIRRILDNFPQNPDIEIAGVGKIE